MHAAEDAVNVFLHVHCLHDVEVAVLRMQHHEECAVDAHAVVFGEYAPVNRLLQGIVHERAVGQRRVCAETVAVPAFHVRLAVYSGTCPGVHNFGGAFPVEHEEFPVLLGNQIGRAGNSRLRVVNGPFGAVGLYAGAADEIQKVGKFPAHVNVFVAL